MFLKYPKFHCELNFIEMYWGATKLKVRRLCDYSMKTLVKNVPIILDSIPLGLIRRFVRKSWRYMDAYRQGATGRLADFINKKYKGHRCIPTSWLNEVQDAYYSKYGEKAEINLRAAINSVEPRAPTVVVAATEPANVAPVSAGPLVGRISGVNGNHVVGAAAVPVTGSMCVSAAQVVDVSTAVSVAVPVRATASVPIIATATVAPVYVTRFGRIAKKKTIADPPS